MSETTELTEKTELIDQSITSLTPVDQLRAKIANLELDKENLYRQIESIDSQIAKTRRKIDLCVMIGSSADSAELISSILTAGSSNPEDRRFPAVEAAITMTSEGQPGQIKYDNQFLYVCVDQNTWRRCPLVMWVQK